MRDASPRSSNSRRAEPRRLVAFALFAATLFTPLALSASPAAAQYEHGPVSAEFGPDGTSSSSFSGIGGLAYQQSEKRLYALTENKIDAFEIPSPGTYTPIGGEFPKEVPNYYYSSAVAVDNTAGSTAGHLFWDSFSPILGFDSTGKSLSGSPIGEKETCGVAVDDEGHVWGASYNDEAVYEWGSEGGPLLRTISTAVLGRPCHLAFDQTNGDLYISSYQEGAVEKLTASSNYTSPTLIEGLRNSNTWIAVNGARHVVYIASPYLNEVQAFSTINGDPIETIETDGAVRGLAVSEATDALFVATEPSRIEYHGIVEELRGIEIPVATTGEPTANRTVGGTADPDGAGPITRCEFEYGLSGSAYEGSVPCEQSLPIAASSQVTATLPLLGEKNYRYRLVLGNAEGPAFGEDRTVVAHNITGFKTTEASDLTRTTAQLNGKFEGTGEDTTYHFEYGLTESYGEYAPAQPAENDAGATTGPTTISQPVEELLPDTTYHYRAVGTNPRGTNVGADQTFHTLPAVIDLKTEIPTEVTSTKAVLNGSFTGDGTLHTYYFEWGQSGSYGHTTAVQSSSATGTIHASAPIEGLEPNLPGTADFHFRLVVTNPLGTTYTADRPFTAAGPAAPVVGGERVSGVTPTHATVAASINPSKSETIFVIEYGTTSNYGSATELSESIGSDGSDHEISETLSELTPGTAYHYRVVAYNFGGTAHGLDQTFVTPAPPKVESAAASAVTTSSALLTATVGAGGLATTAGFEYGPTTAYGSSTADQDLVGSLGFAEIEAKLTGLSPGTTYHFRAMASNAIGDGSSSDQTFTTSPAPEEKTTHVLTCKKGFVKKHGKCVKKHKPKKKRKHRHG